MTEATEETTPKEGTTEPTAPAAEPAKPKTAAKPRTTKPKAAKAEKAPKELPLAAHNDSFYATLDENANGIPTVSVLPVGWVGAAPLQISEPELDDLIDALTQLKR